MGIPSKSDDELRVIARDYAEARIYTDRNCPPDMLSSVFMVAALGGLSDQIEYLKQHPEADDALGLIYEYLSEAGSRSVNGCPMFMSLKVLNKADAKRVGEHLNHYESLQSQFSGTATAK